MIAVLLVALLSLAGANQPALAQAAVPAQVTCGGRDLAADLRQRDPTRYEAAMARARATFSNLDGRFWLIERPGTPPSMLFGTIHIADRRATIPAYLAMAMSDARVVAVELEDALTSGPKNKAFAARMVMAAMNPSANSVDSLSAEHRNLIEHHLELRGFPRQAAEAFRPWMLYTIVSFSACDMRLQGASSGILDARVLALRGQRTTVASLETAEEQIQALSGLPDDLALKAILPTLRSVSENDDLFATFIGLYRDGHVGAAMDIALALGTATESDRSTALEILRLFKGERDRRMAERALPLLAEGSAVIVVGALHLIGEGGLIQRFRDAGYTLTRLDRAGSP